MMKKITATAIVLNALFNTAMSQDSTKGTLKVSGSVDAYYRFNPGADGASFKNNLTSFTNSNNTFQLGMASVKAEYTHGKVGVVADLGFGTRAEEFSYADEGTLQAVKQAYFYYSPSDKVKFTFGKFGTHVGYELLDPQLNKNYSMSYMFTNGPFSHTGVKADFTLGGGAGLMVGIANPIDVTAPEDGNTPKTILFQLSKVSSNFSVFLNYAGYFGAKIQMPTASSFNQVGLTASYTVSDKFSLGYDGTIQMVKDEVADQSKSWWGSALYANLTTSSNFGLTFRGEYFSDKKYGIKTGTNILAATLSGNYKVGGFILVPEIRLDNANAEIFSKNGIGDPTKTSVSALLAAIFSF
ncbi:MAG TPA: outer membrane beta-barrel protein [Ferruginibacter sp.]|nr:outer membrane beta-barrel protein [Ferruginibacter sp.]HPH91276.1 outer membrane beta-barrel protein [Ferruginibacter sp.]